MEPQAPDELPELLEPEASEDPFPIHPEWAWMDYA